MGLNFKINEKNYMNLGGTDIVELIWEYKTP